MVEVEHIENFELEASVVTIGIFDGIHLAHRELVQKLKNASKKYNLPSVLITMWPHPRKVLFPKTELLLLTSLEEKKEIINSLGIDYLIVHPFNQDFAGTSYKDFVRNNLVNQLGVKYVVIGFNHHFGKNREGDFDHLKGLANENNFLAEQLPQVYLNEGLISSSEIRKLLLKGEVEKAKAILGYPYFINGTVVEGKKLGRTIGFPTANIEIPFKDKLIPKDGVYAVRVRLNEQIYDGMMNIGTRPTVSNDQKKSIEVHIFNFNRIIYKENLKIEFVERLRNEMKFNSINQLKDQLHLDTILTNQILKNK